MVPHLSHGYQPVLARRWPEEDAGRLSISAMWSARDGAGPFTGIIEPDKPRPRRGSLVDIGTDVINRTPRGSPNIVETVLPDGLKIRTQEPPDMEVDGHDAIMPLDHGILDGRWKATYSHAGIGVKEDLVRVIDQDAIKWVDGGMTHIMVFGDDTFSINLRGATVYGKLVGGTLRWDDGDVWERDDEGPDAPSTPRSSTRSSSSTTSL